MKISAQKAIKNFCKGCIYDPNNGGTWLQQIEACTVTKCELYNHRPLTSKTKQIQKEKELELLPPCQRKIEEAKKEKMREIGQELYKSKIAKG